MRGEESIIQGSCVRWFRYQYPQHIKKLIAIPNGGFRSKATAAVLKAEGVMPGASDLALFVPRGGYHGAFIEMKTHIGVVSKAQKEWMAEMEKEGYKTAVVRSLDQFIVFVDEYLNSK